MKTNDVSIIVDARLKKCIESLTSYEGEVCSVKLTDIDETFWFNDKYEAQEFLNVQCNERFADKTLRRGCLTHKNEHNEEMTYNIDKVERGKLTLQNN